MCPLSYPHFCMSVSHETVSDLQKKNPGPQDETLLSISYKDHVTTEDVRRKIQAAIG